MIFEKIQSDILDSVRSQNSAKRDALKYLKSNIQRIGKDSQKDITDDMCISVAKKIINQNLDAIKLVSDTANLFIENAIWSKYIPKMLSANETMKAVAKAIDLTDSSSIKDMGKVMSFLKKEYGQTVDMRIASEIVKERI